MSGDTLFPSVTRQAGGNTGKVQAWSTAGERRGNGRQAYGDTFQEALNDERQTLEKGKRR